jgi:hypothetical protein
MSPGRGGGSPRARREDLGPEGLTFTAGAQQVVTAIGSPLLQDGPLPTRTATASPPPASAACWPSTTTGFLAVERSFVTGVGDRVQEGDLLEPRPLPCTFGQCSIDTIRPSAVGGPDAALHLLSMKH